MATTYFLVSKDDTEELTSWHEVKAGLGDDPDPVASVTVVLTNGDIHEYFGVGEATVIAIVRPAGTLAMAGLSRVYGPAGWMFVDGLIQQPRQ